MVFELGKILSQQLGLRISVQPREFSHYNTRLQGRLINSRKEVEFRIQSKTRLDLEGLTYCEGESWKQSQWGALQGFLFQELNLQKKRGLEFWRVWGFERRRLKRICEVCFVQCGELMHLNLVRRNNLEK